MKLFPLVSAVFAGCILSACTERLPLDPSENECTGHYSYEQLGLWERTSFRRISEVKGISFTDLDEATNCLALGVIDWNLVPAVEAKLREIGIPRDAVYIRLEPYGEMLSVDLRPVAGPVVFSDMDIRETK